MKKFKQELSSYLSESQIIEGNQEAAKVFLQEKRNNFSSQCAYILLPNTVDQVSKIVNLCNNYNVGIVPQAGNTGLVGGSVAFENQIILSSANLNKIYPISKNSYSIQAESGVILNDLKNYASQQNLLFPLSLPSEDKCQVGGNVASNAGGISVLKYGNIRDNVLGIEVVLPSGEIYSDLNILRKRNIGPDFKHLFIGSEGLLGFITAATFKLYPKPNSYFNILFSAQDVFIIQDIFSNFYEEFANHIGAFEIIQKSALDVVIKHYPTSFFPIKNSYPWYAVASFEILSKDTALKEYLEQAIIKIIKNYKVEYYSSSSNDIWDVRYKIPDAQRHDGESLKHDIGVPLGKMASFLDGILPVFNNQSGLYKTVIFGHMGDGNLHFNIAKGNTLVDKLSSHKDKIKALIVDEVMKIGGTFSAEHGVGLVHKQEMLKFYCNNQVNKLKWFKQECDKKNIFNPNKII